MKRGLLLHLELGVNDVFLAGTFLAVAAGSSPGAGGTGSSTLTAQVLFQGLHLRADRTRQQRMANDRLADARMIVAREA